MCIDDDAYTYLKKLKILLDNDEFHTIGQYNEVINICDKIIEFNDNFKEIGFVYFTKAKFLVHRGGYEESIKYFDKCFNFFGEHFAIFYLKGISLKGLGNLCESVKYFDKAIALNPDINNDSIVNLTKGNYFRELKNLEMSISFYDKAIDLDKNNAAAYNNKAIVLSYSRKYVEAAKCYNKAIDLTISDESDILYDIDMVCECYENVKTKKCDGYFYDEDTCSFNCVNSKMYASIGFFGEKIFFDEVIECYDKAIEGNQNDSSLYVGKGNCLFLFEGLIEEILSCYDKAIELNPNDNYLYFLKARAIDDLPYTDKSFTENSEEAIALYKKYKSSESFLRVKDICIAGLFVCSMNKNHFIMEEKWVNHWSSAIKYFLNVAMARREERVLDTVKRQRSELNKRNEQLEEKNKELEEKNKELEKLNDSLQEKEKELEDMMSMFAHKFRSPLDTIIYNTDHSRSAKLYIEAAQTMRGLLDVFSMISTDEKALKEKLKNDKQGNSDLFDVLRKTLNMMLLHFLSESSGGSEKIQQHYIAYAKECGKIDYSVDPKIWNNDYCELECAIRSEWEIDFSKLLNESGSLQECLDWIEQHFFKIELIGFSRTDIKFKAYSVTSSFLTIVFNEILVNAFKYYSSETRQSVVLELNERDGNQVIICHNPSIRKERTTIKGSKKGHVFLSALARKIGSKFSKPKPQDAFCVEFDIPNELLISN